MIRLISQRRRHRFPRRRIQIASSNCYKHHRLLWVKRNEHWSTQKSPTIGLRDQNDDGFQMTDNLSQIATIHLWTPSWSIAIRSNNLWIWSILLHPVWTMQTTEEVGRMDVSTYGDIDNAVIITDSSKPKPKKQQPPLPKPSNLPNESDDIVLSNAIIALQKYIPRVHSRVELPAVVAKLQPQSTVVYFNYVTKARAPVTTTHMNSSKVRIERAKILVLACQIMLYKALRLITWMCRFTGPPRFTGKTNPLSAQPQKTLRRHAIRC